MNIFYISLTAIIISLIIFIIWLINKYTDIKQKYTDSSFNIIHLKKSGGIAGINQEIEINEENVDKDLWDNFLAKINFNKIKEGETVYLNNNIGNDGFVYSITYKNREIVGYDYGLNDPDFKLLVEIVEKYINP